MQALSDPTDSSGNGAGAARPEEEAFRCRCSSAQRRDRAAADPAWRRASSPSQACPGMCPPAQARGSGRGPSVHQSRVHGQGRGRPGPGLAARGRPRGVPRPRSEHRHRGRRRLGAAPPRAAALGRRSRLPADLGLPRLGVVHRRAGHRAVPRLSRAADTGRARGSTPAAGRYSARRRHRGPGGRPGEAGRRVAPRGRGRRARVARRPVPVPGAAAVRPRHAPGVLRPEARRRADRGPAEVACLPRRGRCAAPGRAVRLREVLPGPGRARASLRR